MFYRIFYFTWKICSRFITYPLWDCYFCNYLGERRKIRGEAKVTLRGAYCISLPHDTMLWTHIVFIRVLFWLCVPLCLRWMAKSSDMTALSFVLCKSTTETLEMLCEAFGEHSLSWTGFFEWHSRFKAGRVPFNLTTRPPTCPWKPQSLWLTTTGLLFVPTCWT
jgi:hypothetical protein